MSKRTRNNSKKIDDARIVACSLQIKVLAIQTPSFAFVTPLCISNQDEKSSRSHTVYYHQPCEMQYKISWSTVEVVCIWLMREGVSAIDHSRRVKHTGLLPKYHF